MLSSSMTTRTIQKKVEEFAENSVKQFLRKVSCLQLLPSKPTAEKGWGPHLSWEFWDLVSFSKMVFSFKNIKDICNSQNLFIELICLEFYGLISAYDEPLYQISERQIISYSAQHSFSYLGCSSCRERLYQHRVPHQHSRHDNAYTLDEEVINIWKYDMLSYGRSLFKKRFLKKY